MPLGHCFVKAGDALTAEDKAAIEKMVDSGMSQAEAVDSLMSDVDQQIDSITSQVEAQGGEVKRFEQAEAEGPIKGFFDPEAMRITLTKDADLSTLMHELAHMFLSVYQIYENADPSIAEDLAILDKWFAENGAETDVAKQETFASGFEMYLMEGKAPTPELQSIFSKFKAWLTLVYKNINRILRSDTGKPVTLTKEAREVMDRMLATEEAINQAQAESSFGPLPTQELGLSEENAAEYVKLRQDAREEASTDLTARVMADLKREQRKWWKQGVDRYKSQVEEEINNLTEYKARDYLTGTRIPEGMQPLKLDSKHIYENYAGSNPKKLHHMMNKDGVHPDVVAPLFGYKTGDELVRALLGTMKDTQRKVYIKEQARQMMKEQHGDMMLYDEIPAAAEQLIHNEKQAKLLSMELEFINKKLDPTFVTRGTTRAARQAYQASAREQVRQTPVDQLMPHIHLRNEQKHGREALHFAAKGKWAESRLAKHKQIRQFYLYRESLRAKEQAEKDRAKLRQIQKTEYLPRKVNPDFIQMAKVLVAAYDLRKNPKQSNEMLARVRSFIEAQKAGNPDLQADQSLDSITSWKEMSLEDISALRNAAENLIKAGKTESLKEKEAWNAHIEDGISSAKSNRVKEKSVTPSRFKTVQWKNKFLADHLTLESKLQELDGWKDGWFIKNVFMPIWNSQLNGVAQGKEAHDKMAEIFKDFNYLFNGFKEKLTDIEATKKYVDTYDMVLGDGRTRTLTRGERIVLALNWGNEGNRQAVRNQEKYAVSDAEVLKAISTLTKEELQLVNNIWEFVDSFYEPIAKLEKEIYGISPRKVESDPFVLNGVEMRGGYYPLLANTSFSTAAERKSIQEQIENPVPGMTGRASTRHGSTQERVNFGRQVVELSIDGLFRHVDGVIHDLTHRHAVRNADRILSNSKIREQIESSLGVDGYRSLMQDVLRIARGNIHPSELGHISQFARFSRIAVTYNAMGYAPRTALLNITGFFPAIPEVGAVNMASSLIKQLSNPLEFGTKIKNKSIYMENRGRTINQNIYEILRNMRGNTKWNKFKAYAFWMIGQVDAVVSRSVWDAAYHKAIRNGSSEKDAIYNADRTVTGTQGDGLKINLSNIEDLNEIVRAMSPMYTYFGAILRLGRKQIGKFQTGQISGFDLMHGMFWIYFMPSLVEELWFGRADDDEEMFDDSWWERVARAQASYFAGQWFGVRELSSFIKYGMVFETPMQSAVVGVAEAISEVGELVFDEDAEFDKGSIRAFSGLLPWLHFPTGVEVNRIAGYLWEIEQQGGDVNLYDMVVTGRPEE